MPFGRLPYASEDIRDAIRQLQSGNALSNDAYYIRSFLASANGAHNDTLAGAPVGEIGAQVGDRVVAVISPNVLDLPLVRTGNFNRTILSLNTINQNDASTYLNDQMLVLLKNQQ